MVGAHHQDENRGVLCPGHTTPCGSSSRPTCWSLQNVYLVTLPHPSLVHPAPRLSWVTAPTFEGCAPWQSTTGPPRPARGPACLPKMLRASCPPFPSPPIPCWSPGVRVEHTLAASHQVVAWRHGQGAARATGVAEMCSTGHAGVTQGSHRGAAGQSAMWYAWAVRNVCRVQCMS